jgi:hypothetical protein
MALARVGTSGPGGRGMNSTTMCYGLAARESWALVEFYKKNSSVTEREFTKFIVFI